MPSHFTLSVTRDVIISGQAESELIAAFPLVSCFNSLRYVINGHKSISLLSQVMRYLLLLLISLPLLLHDRQDNCNWRVME